MTARVPVDSPAVKAAGRLADSIIPDARAEELVPVMDGVYGLLDSLHLVPLGDAPLPTSFDASWTGDDR